jgi:hypothetical protein
MAQSLETMAQLRGLTSFRVDAAGIDNGLQMTRCLAKVMHRFGITRGDDLLETISELPGSLASTPLEVL